VTRAPYIKLQFAFSAEFDLEISPSSVARARQWSSFEIEPVEAAQ
jgi:hypothetical protein